MTECELVAQTGLWVHVMWMMRTQAGIQTCMVIYKNMIPVQFSFEYFIKRACIVPFSAHLMHLQLLFLLCLSIIIIWPWWSSQQMLVNARDILFEKLCTIVNRSWAWLYRRVKVFAAVIQMWVLENRGFALFSSFALICRALPTGSAPRTVPCHSGHTRTYTHSISHTRWHRVSNSHHLTSHS